MYSFFFLYPLCFFVCERERRRPSRGGHHYHLVRFLCDFPSVSRRFPLPALATLAELPAYRISLWVQGLTPVFSCTHQSLNVVCHPPVNLAHGIIRCFEAFSEHSCINSTSCLGYQARYISLLWSLGKMYTTETWKLVVYLYLQEHTHYTTGSDC